VIAGLEKLMQREPALVAVLPRQPGSRESRYAHLLSGEVSGALADEDAGVAARVASVDQDGRVARLEETVAELQNEVAELRKKIEDLFG
jgi:uncharacterized protein YceH (UPF0502 family)